MICLDPTYNYLTMKKIKSNDFIDQGDIWIIFSFDSYIKKY